MKRRIPTLRHHKASGQAVVSINGRDHYLGRYGSQEAQREYERVVGEWLVTGGTSPAATRSVTIAELVLGYRKWAATYYGPPSNEPDQIRLAVRPVLERYGHMPATAFGPVALKACREVWIEQGNARRYINGRVGRIVRMFCWGVEHELIPAETWHALRAVKGLRAGRSLAKETPPVEPVPDDVFAATLAEIGSPQVRAILQLVRLTGARPGEICGMWSGGVDRSTTPWTFTPRHHKTAHHGHQRSIYIGPRAREILEPWLRDDAEEYLFQPREAVAAIREAGKVAHRTDADRSRAARNKRNADARGRGGKPQSRRLPSDHYTPGRLGHAIGRACKRAGIPHWHPHQLRHSAATELRREIGIEAARVTLGHKSAAMTEVYAAVDRTAAARAMEQLG